MSTPANFQSSSCQGPKLTDFQWRVLKAITQIPLGQTRSYAWVAKKVKSPKAVRAVGQALKKNPYPVVIPCHRVIRSDGSLGGYALGLRRKRILLELEKETVQKFLKK
ncbi:MAG: MGMT family protein [Candidatus Aceula meridiana]|nr:MGMT family protein [Candidatus Aceula meridiana]